MSEQENQASPSRVLEGNFSEFLVWYDSTKEENLKHYESWKSSDDAGNFGDISFHQYLMNVFFQMPQGGSFKRSLLGCMVQELGENKLIGLNKEKGVVEIPLTLLQSKEEEKAPAASPEEQPASS